MTRNEKETNVAVSNHIANCLNYVPDQVDGGGCKEEKKSLVATTRIKNEILNRLENTEKPQK